MQKVVMKEALEEYRDYMDESVIACILDNQTETFEGFSEYDLLAFEWYDVEQEDIRTSQIMIYLDREVLFFLCGDDRSYEKVTSLLKEGEENEQALFRFFSGLLRNDLNYLAELEDEITEAEDEAIVSSRRVYLGKIVLYRG